MISLAFAANSAHLFTTSLDGTVFGLALEGLQEGTEAQLPPVTNVLEVCLAKQLEEGAWGASQLAVLCHTPVPHRQVRGHRCLCTSDASQAGGDRTSSLFIQ